MLTFPYDNGPRGIERLPIDEAKVQELVDFLFTTKRYLQDTEHLERKLRKFKQDAVVEGRAAQARAAATSQTAGDWEERARELHRSNPRHWTAGRIAYAVHRPTADVELALAAA